MRDAAEKLVGDAVALALLLNGCANGCLTADETNDCLKIESPDSPLVRTPGANS